MKMNEVVLPNGWAMATVGDLADYVNGRAFKPTEWKDAGKPIIRIQNLNKVDAKYNFSPENHEEKYLVRNGDLLFAWSASLGAYIWQGGDAWLNQHIFVVHSKKCTTKLFVFYLLEKITAELYAKAHGSGMVHVTKGKFESTEISLPPLKEQHRIVAKIEELFSELDKGIENLKTAQAQLQVYRQALLKHAFEGKLTAQWRSENQDKLETADALLKRIQQERTQRYQQQLADWKTQGGSKPKTPKPIPPLTAEELAVLPELPAGWVYAYLSDLGDLGRGKSKHRPRNDPRLFGGIYPFVQTGDVKAANRIIKMFSQTLNEFGLQQSKLWPTGTLCITIAANIAETAFLGFDGCFPDSVVGYTAFKKTIAPEYVDFFIQAARTRIEAYAPATAQKNINLETLENLVVPYCCTDEQKQILGIIEERFSIVDQLELTISTSLQQAEALRQSILKKAFSGQLVPQDPHDEPASALLARIKAEREQTTQPKRKGKQA